MIITTNLYYNRLSSQQSRWNTESYLMLHVVLHVHMTTSKNFKTEWTEKVFRIFVDTSEMCLHLWEERGPIIAHLRKECEQTVRITKHLALNLKPNHSLLASDRPGRHRASPRACGCPSCVPGALARTRMPVHISCNSLKEGKEKLQMATQCLTKQESELTRKTMLYTWGFDGAVGALNVALQLEWSHVLPVAMLASCVVLPAFTVLLFQLQMVLHMVHEPANEDIHTHILTC